MKKNVNLKPSQDYTNEIKYNNIFFLNKAF